ncbi:uncharacterized protein BDR25DRAFT_91972 [Lindgomyces ingoldianus]|uniref:Uncharacterized protein n=1 Tax=Lindgomyces ingoldianus TaxID=673940 RepID=A0ACB6QDR9_9PLEO|nr:uncharacterized protein BDR25DRAFT_91972 [Lindgomyces ingoldianus]KAF2465000.1 hypothetical protein BDR25DRAFT_91972 [Lindgomyces ingoldianus]
MCGGGFQYKKSASPAKRSCPPVSPGCRQTLLVKSGDYCQLLADENNLTLQEFYALNPSIDTNNCPNLILGCSYCVKGPGPDPNGCPPTTDPTCTSWYTVNAGEWCLGVASGHGISLSDFYAWNPSIHNWNCDNMLAGCAYCVAKNNVDGCPTIHPTCPGVNTKVLPGQICWGLVNGDPTRLTKFYQLNPSVDSSDCRNLLAGCTYCVPN